MRRRRPGRHRVHARRHRDRRRAPGAAGIRAPAAAGRPAGEAVRVESAGEAGDAGPSPVAIDNADEPDGPAGDTAGIETAGIETAGIESTGVGTAAIATAEDSAAPATRGLTRPPAALIAGGMALGLVVRIAVLRSSIGALDADEAVVGLMARQFGLGHLQAFYWGQAYGGTIEQGLAAMAFKLLGSSTVVLKAVPLLLDAVAAILVWRIGRRLTSPAAAILGGLLFWLWPATYLWWSIKERGFYEACLCLSLAAVCIGLRIGADRSRRHWLDWSALGLVSGLGWWQSPQIAYTLIPLAGWLILRLRTAVWRSLVAVPTLALGALPWLVANVGGGFASLVSPEATVTGGYVDHLGILAARGLPMTVGLKLIYSNRWLISPPVAISVYVGVLGVVLLGCARAWPGGRLVVALLVAFPFLHAALPVAGAVGEGRYTLFVVPWLALALAHRATTRWAAIALGTAALAVTAAGIAGIHGRTSPYFSERRVPTSFSSLETGLAARGITRAWSNYWVAYRVTFESAERIIVAPATNDRHHPYAEAVASAPHPAAHIFLSHTAAAERFGEGLAALGVPYEQFGVGSEWIVYVPDAAVGPTAIEGTFP